VKDTPLDYAGVGLMVGLEVHQQLLTARKLFCRCPAGVYTTTHDAQILRHMRPTLSELGGYDGTALMEFRTKKQIIYLLNRKNVCTYEMDDTPPFLVDPQAIDVAIEICLLLGCDIVDEIHIARKQYLDGSIPTGFQRTAIVGVGGSIPFKDRRLTVWQVSIEEDSCREVTDHGHLVTWRTDRLGMPLIETVTAPELRTPEETAEAILLIGRLCRSTKHVRTGIGASRQDVNVSVRGGTRVEIKGVSRAAWAPALVHHEAWRQVNLLKIKDRLLALGFARRADLDVSTIDATALVARSACALLRADGWDDWVARQGYRPTYELGEGAFGVLALRLGGVREIVEHPTQPGRTFADELRGRVRVIAGLDQSPILLTDASRSAYPDCDREWAALRSAAGCAERDALVVVWGPRGDLVTAQEEIASRLGEATEGVPSETRQPFPDGHSDFERILPGPDRMYPDTDSPPTRVTREHVARLAAQLPPPPWDREARYCRAGVPVAVARYLVRKGGASLVDRLAPAGGAPERLRRACRLVGESFKAWRRARIPVDRISDDRWVELFGALETRPALRDCARELVVALAADPVLSLEAAIAAQVPDAAPADWRGALRDAVAARTGERARLGDEARLRHHVGRGMDDLRGRVHGREVARVVGDLLAHAGGGTR